MRPCVKCEVTRAKIVAHALRLIGTSHEDIARKLTDTFRAEYYVEGEHVYRVGSVAPYDPYLIL